MPRDKGWTTSRLPGRRSACEALKPPLSRRDRSDLRPARDRVRARAARLRGTESARWALGRTADLALARRCLLRLIPHRDGRRVASGDQPDGWPYRLAGRRCPLRVRLADQLVRARATGRRRAASADLTCDQQRRTGLAGRRLLRGNRPRTRARACACNRRRLDRRGAAALAGSRAHRARRLPRARRNDGTQPDRTNARRAPPSRVALTRPATQSWR